MEQHDNVCKAMFAVGATLLQFLFGGWSLPLQILVAFIVIDYVSGVVAAFVGQRLDSRVGVRGIARKVGFLMLVAVAHLLDVGTGMEAPILQTATTWFLIANEGISITENLGEIGVPIPKSLQEALRRLRDDEGPSGGD
ncbi:MAG TPA: phage holin family protein [Aggregatilineales bacterium]|nr:phage holin family protein [Aggregatilineales bacterium]